MWWHLDTHYTQQLNIRSTFFFCINIIGLLIIGALINLFFLFFSLIPTKRKLIQNNEIKVIYFSGSCAGIVPNVTNLHKKIEKMGNLISYNISQLEADKLHFSRKSIAGVI